MIRILGRQPLALRLDAMGWEEKSLEHVRDGDRAALRHDARHRPHRLRQVHDAVLVRQAVASPDVNVTTVEDPVEYRMDGINQVPVNPKRGLTFAGALRSILRQDPDIVLVGEVRDKETADIAVKAALTGHLVLSTLHTNDASSTITRLVDMGIDPFMVSSSILCICAQRLGRRLCTHCRHPHRELAAERLLEIGFREEDFEDLHLFTANPRGCSRCNGGYRGRFPILETLHVAAPSPHGRGGRVRGRAQAQAVDEGMLTLRRVGILNAMRGITSVEEVLRITLDD